MSDLLYPDECYAIIGACFNLYKDKGSGFLEPVYQECLEIELAAQGILFVAQPKLTLEYRGQELLQTYQPDFICFNRIILEIKAASKLIAEHRAQVINYLYATQMKAGLLANFGHYPKLEYEKFVNTGQRKLL